jgi:hypothetical protein
VPVGPVIFRVGLLSALAAAGTAALIYWTASGILSGINRGASRNIALIVAPLSGVLLFAFAKTPWSQAVVVEVYALQALLVMLFMAACAHALAEPRNALAHWPWVVLTLALALTNHLTGVLLLPAFLMFVVLAVIACVRGGSFRPLPLWRGLAAGILPLLLYLYLPLRSRAMPPVVWDYVDTWHRFYVHVTGRQYRGALSGQGFRFEELERFLTQQLPTEATWILIVLAAVGLWVLLHRFWRFGLLTIMVAGALLLYNMAYPIHDIHLYYIPVVAIMGLWAAVGGGALVRLATRWHSLIGGAVCVLLCLSCLLPLTNHWRANDQSDFKLLDHYVRDTLAYLDENAVLFSGHWDRFSSPALYIQTVEGFRPDVLVIDRGGLASPTLEKRLDQAAPELADGCREDLRVVAELARLSEQGKPYSIAEGRAHFARMKRTLLMGALGLRPTYVTSDMQREPMLKNLRLIPEGLAFRVGLDPAYWPFPIPDFRGPGVLRAQVRNGREADVHSEYGAMLHNRAHYLRRHGRETEADSVTRRATEVSR